MDSIIHRKYPLLVWEKVDIQHFNQLYKTIQLEKRKQQVRIAQQKRKEKSKAKNPEQFDEQNRKASAKSKQKSRAQNPEKFDEGNKKASAKSKEKSRNQNTILINFALFRPSEPLLHPIMTNK